MPRRTLLAIAIALLASPPLLAQGTITSGTAEFVRGESPWDMSPVADFRGVSTTLSQDHLFETGWWFRVAGDTQEFFFPPPTSQSYVGSSSTIEWADVASRGLFSAVEFSSVIDTTPFSGTPSGYVLMVMTLTNLTGSTLDVDVFHLVDFDVAGSANDSAALVEWSPLGIIEISDPSGNVAQYAAASGWSGYLVAPFGGGDVAAQLSDSAITNFANTGLPFGPADFTGGWQFPLRIPPAASLSVQVVLVVNASAHCNTLVGIFCDGFESSNTSIWSFAVN